MIEFIDFGRSGKIVRDYLEAMDRRVQARSSRESGTQSRIEGVARYAGCAPFAFIHGQKEPSLGPAPLFWVVPFVGTRFGQCTVLFPSLVGQDAEALAMASSYHRSFFTSLLLCRFRGYIFEYGKGAEAGSFAHSDS